MNKRQPILIFLAVTTTLTAIYFFTKKKHDLSSVKYDLPKEVKELAAEKQYFNKEQRKKISQLISSTITVNKSMKIGLNMQRTLGELRLDLEKIKSEKPKDMRQVAIDLEAIKSKIELHIGQMKKESRGQIDYSEAYSYFDKVKNEIDKVVLNSEINFDSINSLLKQIPEEELKTSFTVGPSMNSMPEVLEVKTSFNKGFSFINEAHAELPTSCQSTYQATTMSENYLASEYLSVSDAIIKPNAEILELSRKLNSSSAMYNYVRENIKYYPTFGFTQNAQTVLKTQKANSYDKSTLLVSLLRSAGIPARYVIGEVWISESKLQRVWDIERREDVWPYYASILYQRYKDNKISNTNKLYKSINGELYYLVPHVWVETYTNVSDEIKKKWVQLDPTFVIQDENRKQELVDKIFEISNDLNLKIFTYEDFFFEPDPLDGKIVKRETADLFSARKINGLINYSQTNNYKWDNKFLNYFQITPVDVSKFSELPYGPIGEVVCVFEKTAIPNLNYFPKVKFGFEGVSQIIPIIEFADKLISFRYRGYTSIDSSKLDLYAKGQYSNPSDIKLIAQLFIDDELIKESTSIVNFGPHVFYTMDFVDTNGMWVPETNKRGPNRGGVFSYQDSISPSSQLLFDQQIQKLTNEINTKDITALSFQEKTRLTGLLVASSITRLKIDNENRLNNISSLFNQKVLRPAMQFTMGSGFKPIVFNDRNYGFSPELPHLSIDGIWTTVGSTSSTKTMSDVAYAFQSQQEHQIMENHFNVSGRSSVFILQYAKENGIPIVKGDYNLSNIDSILGQLIGYGTASIDEYRNGMLNDVKEGFFYAPKYPVTIDGITYRVAFSGGVNGGGLGALINSNKGGAGGEAEEDSNTGFTEEVAGDIYNEMGGNLKPDSKQVKKLAAGDSNAGICSSVRQPVNLNNGGMWHKFSDISPMGSGTKLKASFIRTYLAKESNELSVLGYGWTHNLNLYLKTYDDSLLDITKNQDIYYFDGDGNKSLITFEDEEFVILPSRNVKFKKENGNFVLWDRDYNIMTFYGSGDLVGKISKITDRNGNTLTFFYDSQTRLLNLVQDIDGRTLEFNYVNGLMTKVTDFTGRSISFSYDVRKDLIESTNLLGNKTVYTYYNGLTPIELNHNLKSFKNENNEGVEYFYYKNDKTFRHIEAENKVSTFIYDTYNQQTTVVNGNNERTVYRYDVLGNVVSVENPDHTIRDAKYDLFNAKVYEKDESNYVTTYKTDSRGNITEIIPPAPFGKTVISYDPKFNIPNQVTDPKGNRTFYEIDPANGNTLSIKQYPSAGKELVTRLNYDNRGEVISIIDPKQNELTISRALYIEKSQRITITDAEGGVQTQVIDPLGQMISSKDVNGIENTFSYDHIGNVLSTANTQSGITQDFEYDKSNNLLKVDQNIDGKKLTKSYKYDGLGNVIESTNERGETYKLSYKQAGCLCTETSNAKEIVDPKGGVTKFEHDWRGNVIYQIDPRGVKTRMKYDPRGNLADVTVYNLSDINNSKISFVYGANNLLTEKSEVVGYATVLNRNTFKNSDPARDVIVKTLYNYDLSGNLSEKIITRPASGDIARINYSYNGINKLTGVESSGYKHNVIKTLSYDDNSNLIDIVQNDTRVGFQFDKVNRPIVAETFSDASGNVKQPSSILKYTYTLGGQVKSIKDASGLELAGYEFDVNFLPNIVRSGKYTIVLENDSLGRKTKIAYPNKVETTFAFDNFNRIEEIETSDVASMKYQYDELSNISRIKSESGQFDYAYDHNSSLIGAYYKGGEGIKDEKFVWDASGNRMNGSRDPEGNSNRPRPIVINNGLFEDAEPISNGGVGRYSFIYDMHGNVIKKFDNESNVYYVFEYDADNKLVYAEKYNNDSLELKAKYTYDGLGRRIEKEVTKDGTVKRKSYIYNGDNIFQEFNTSNATPVETAKYIGSGLIDDNLITIRNGKGYFYHKDHLGSITAITTDTGEVMQKNTYSSFGKILSIKDKERKELGFAKALEQPFYYTGREWDEEIDMYYYRARNYDPQTGRFLTPDPIGLAGDDTNLYRYVGNNPMKYTDPLGLIVNDNTFGGIPGFIKNGPLYTDLQNRPEIVNIGYDYLIGAAGITTPLRDGVVNVSINPNNQIDLDDYYDTILHELNHAQRNIVTNNDFSMGMKNREILDTKVYLPEVLQDNGLNSCGRR